MAMTFRRKPSESPRAGQPNGTGKPTAVQLGVFRTLTMPNGRQIKVMREDAFKAALAASRKATA